MLIPLTIYHRQNDRQRRRRGATLIELLVSFSLLTTLLGISLPLVVRQNRILASARHYRLALDELSNQVERIVSLPPEDVPKAVEKLAPSPFAAKYLAGAKLSGVVAPADTGERVTLSITWDEPGRDAAPLSLTAWLPPDIGETDDAAEGETP